MPTRIYKGFKTTKVSVSLREHNKLKLALLASTHRASLSYVLDRLLTDVYLEDPMLRQEFELLETKLGEHLAQGGTLQDFMERLAPRLQELRGD